MTFKLTVAHEVTLDEATAAADEGEIITHAEMFGEIPSGGTVCRHWAEKIAA